MRGLIFNGNGSTLILAVCKCRLRNSDVIDLVIIEVQSGDHMREDGILRFEDHYGRILNFLQSSSPCIEKTPVQKLFFAFYRFLGYEQ